MAEMENLSIAFVGETKSLLSALKGVAGAMMSAKDSSEAMSKSLDKATDSEAKEREEAEKSEKIHSKLATVFGAVGKGAMKGFSMVGKAMKNHFTPNLKTGFLQVLRYAFGIRSLFVLLNRLRAGIKEGFGNLRQYSTGVDSALTSMTNSLTTVKNALAVAFAPIVTTIAPYINILLNAITQLLNKFAQLMGALTGKTIVVQAVNGLGGVGGAIDNVGGSAGKSKKKVDDLKKALMGFDEINKLPSVNDNASGSGGGAGGGGGATDVSNMFETVDVDSGVSKFAQLLKDSWAKADFTEVGQIVGDKINGGLQSIKWEKIKTTSYNIGKSVATFINGALESNVNGQSIGTTVGVTIAEGLNSAVNYYMGIGGNLNFRGVGEAIADAFNGVLRNFSFKNLAQTISMFATGFFDAVSSFFQKADPSAVADGITGFFSHINYGDIIISIIEALGSAVMFGLKTLTEIGANIVEGIMRGIWDFKNWGKTIKKFFKKLVEAVKRVFGIHSPAKAKEIRDIGKNIVLGILNGFTGGFDKIKEWAKKLLDKIVKKFKDIKDGKLTITDLLGDALEGISEWVSSVKEAIKEKWGETTDFIESGISATVDIVTGTITGAIGWLYNKGKAVTKTLTVTVSSGVASTLSTIKEKWDKIKSGTKSLVSKFTDKGSSALKKVSDWWGSIKAGAKNLSSKFTETGSSVLQKVSSAWGSIKSSTKSFTLKVTGTGADIIKKAKERWDGLKSKVLNLSGSIKLPKISWTTKTFSKGPVSINYPWPSVSWQKYATGGFPEEGPFFMNKGEIAGKFSNGKSVVANNRQITDGIAYAVSSSMYNALSQAMRENNGFNGNNNNKQPIVVKIGERTVYNGFVDYVKNTTYSTGVNPIMI